MATTSNRYLQKWQSIPSAVKVFLLKAIALFVIWKIIYYSFLIPGPTHISIFTRNAGQVTASGLNLFTHSHSYSSKTEMGTDQDFNYQPIQVLQQSVYFLNKKIVGIYDGCNALDLFVLYAGFIICMPAPLKKKIIFSVAGIALIYLVNILRCAGITYMIQYYPKQADFAHHFLFVFIVYALIIVLWLIFANNLKLKYNDKK